MELIVELGFPELPSGTIAPAAQELLDGLVAAAEAAGLLGDERTLHVYSTPRRLAAFIGGLGPRQPDRIVEVRGPSLAAALGTDGEYTQAALGFARSQGIPPEQLERRETPQGAYLFARREVPGKPATEILAAAVADVAGSLHFPRTMRWAKGAPRLPRPLGWLLALLDGEVLAVSIGPVAASDVTYAHRVLAPGSLPVGGHSDYPEVLRRGFVEPDRARRMQQIKAGVGAAAAAEGLVAEMPEGLLEEVTDLCEWPRAFVGRFAPEYLDVPDPVLVATMVHHQRFFPLRDSEGRLAARFAAVRNGGEEDTVRRGNETVLAARLADALFFFREDLKTPFAQRRDELKGIVYAPGLGSLYERSERLEALARSLGQAAGRGDLAPVLGRAAALSLCDRATALVRELPELEGTMGGAYAARSGEPAEVCQAIASRVRPRGGDDELPADDAGRILALADRLDQLVGFLAVGKAPTGSQDPFGLRRAAIGALRLWELLPDLPLTPALADAAKGYADLLGDKALAAVDAVRPFLAARLAARAQETGHDPRIAQAVLASGIEYPSDVMCRIEALEAAAGADVWPRLVQAARRAKNLASEGSTDGAEGAEAELLREIRRLEAEGGDLLARRDYAGYLRRASELFEPLDRFFAAVMVMAEDPEVRGRRQALLYRAHTALSQVAEIAALSAAD